MAERSAWLEAKLWFGLLGGAAAWSAHLLASYPSVRVACAAGGEWLLHGITAVTALVAASATAVAWREWRAAGSDGGLGSGVQPASTAGPDLGRVRFMAGLGTLLSLLFFVVTVVEGLPVFFADPCMRGP